MKVNMDIYLSPDGGLNLVYGAGLNRTDNGWTELTAEVKRFE